MYKSKYDRSYFNVHPNKWGYTDDEAPATELDPVERAAETQKQLGTGLRAKTVIDASGGAKRVCDAGNAIRLTYQSFTRGEGVQRQKLVSVSVSIVNERRAEAGLLPLDPKAPWYVWFLGQLFDEQYWVIASPWYHSICALNVASRRLGTKANCEWVCEATADGENVLVELLASVKEGEFLYLPSYAKDKYINQLKAYFA
jgi:hypothetical protein